MDYGDDDVPTRLLERWWGPVEQPGGPDPEARLGFGYVPNQTIASMPGGDPRWRPLIDAVYTCLA